MVDYNQTFSPEDFEYQNKTLMPEFKTVAFSGATEAPSYTEKLIEINTRAPWLSPETMLSLAKANASTEAIDRVGQFAGQRQLDTYEERVSNVGKLSGPVRWAYSGLGWAAKTAKSIYDATIPGPAKFIIGDTAGATRQGLGNIVGEIPIKPITRWGVATLDIIPETIQNVGSMAFGQSSYDIGGLWSSTSIASMLDARDQGIDIGSGYLMSERVRQEQARRARLFRGTVNGSAFTIGRGAAQTIFKEGSQEYNYASGIIDAIITIAAPDPTKGLVKGVKAVSGGIGARSSGLAFAEGFKAGGGIRGIVPLLSAEDAVGARKYLKEYADNAHGEAGLLKDITGGSVRTDKFINWMRQNPSAKKLVSALRDESSPATIQDDIFKYKISNDAAIRLANAKTDEEVISALTYGWTYGDNALSANIGKYRVSRRPFTEGLRKSKYFTQFPRQQIIVDGDELQSAEAVKNAVNTLRSSGVPEKEVRLWLDGTPATADAPGKMGAVRAFTQMSGTAVDRKNALLSFNDLISITLRANGVVDPVIQRVLYSATDHIDRVKSYYTTRTGHPTDNGHLSMQLEQYREMMPPDLFNTWLEGLGQFGADLEFAQPMQIVDMLNRVQILPDVRQLRRLTRNRLFANLVPKDEKGIAVVPKLAITSRKRLENLTEITDEVAHTAADDELEILKRLEGPARINARERIDELSDIKASFERPYTARVISGDQRILLSYIERIQNDIWKPLNLATFGYILRNGIDAQLRMAYGGVNKLTHPMDYINLVLGSRYSRDIRGVNIVGLGTEKVGKTADEAADAIQGPEGYAARSGSSDVELQRKVLDQLRENLSYGADRVGYTASDQYSRNVETGSFPVFSRQSGPSTYPQQFHTDGIVQASQKIIADPLQNIAARGLSSGLDDEKIIDEVMEFLKDTRSTAMRRLQSLYNDGINYWENGQLLKGLPVNLAALRKSDPAAYQSQLRNHIRTIVLPNVKKDTGMLDEVIFMAAHDRVPKFKETVNIPVGDFELRSNQTVLKVGDLQTTTVVDSITGVPKKVEGIINNISIAPDGSKIATFVPVGPAYALSRGASRGSTGTRDARRIIENAPLYDEATGKGLPQRIPREQRSFRKISQPDFRAMDTAAVNWFFNNLNDKAVRVLEKSPTFRTFYYRTVGEHIDELSADEGLKLYDDIFDKAKSEKKTIREYLGESSFQKNGVGDKIENLPTRVNVTGTLTVDELNDFARFKGISDTKDLLYDATNRNNFGDAFRVISPFAGAFADVMATWLNFSRTHNVQVARSAQRVYTGLQNADPDQDGRGIFFKDPQTDQLMFSFPMTGALSKILTGIDSPLAGPVQRLSGGIGFYPALGPWGQYAVSKLIPDTPDYRQFRELLMPYGAKSITRTLNPLPGYIEKALGALRQDTEDLTSVYGQTYIEVLRALSVNPEYDLSDPEDITRIKSEAKSKAGILTMMRAVSQFTGPTSGTLEIKVPTQIGDVYVSELIKQLQLFQEEDYDTAIPRFLELYGDELVLYASSKTKASMKGLETSIEFDDWTRTNQGLLDQYPNLATYFAPKGSDFEFSVWDRQKRAGMRVPLSDSELIETAQNRLGATKYRAARQMFGAYPTKEQSVALRNYRIYLNEQLPGFPVNVEFKVNELKNDLVDLRKMTQDKRLAENPMVVQVVAYLNAHDSALSQVGGKSLQSQKATPLRAQLFAYGEALALQNPEFDRIWNRLLSAEVED